MLLIWPMNYTHTHWVARGCGRWRADISGGVHEDCMHASVAMCVRCNESVCMCVKIGAEWQVFNPPPQSRLTHLPSRE